MKFDNFLKFIFGKAGIVLLLAATLLSLVFSTACITEEDVNYVCFDDGSCEDILFCLWDCDTYTRCIGCTCDKMNDACSCEGGEGDDTTCVGESYNCAFGKVWDCASCDGCEGENVCKYCKTEYYAPIMYNGKEVCPNCMKPIK